MVSATTVPAGHTRRARPDSTAWSASIHSEAKRTTAARCHPIRSGRSRLAAGLGGHAQLGERRPQSGPLVHQHQVHVTEQGESETHPHAVHRRQQRLVEGHHDVEQIPEP